METLAVFIKLGLSFYVLTISYLLLIYYVRSKYLKVAEPEKVVKSKRNFHISIIFNNLATGEEIICMVQKLNLQEHKNFTACFFTEPCTGFYNAHQSVVVVQTREQNKGFNYLDIAKTVLPQHTHAMLVLNIHSDFDNTLLSQINHKLNEGHEAIQLKVEPELTYDWGLDYKKTSRRVLNLIDRESRNIRGLSASLWSTGFIITANLFHKLKFTSFGNNDKAIQSSLLAQSVKIEYAPMAMIIEPLKEQPINWIEHKKTSWQFYIQNLIIGFNLLMEGIKNPSADKIAFGLNYLRPPLWLMLSASCIILMLEFSMKSGAESYMIICIPGLVISMYLLLRPKFIEMLKPSIPD